MLLDKGGDLKMLEVLIFFCFAVLIGIMFAFFGYPFFRFLLPIWGFFAGLSFGFNGIEQLLGTGFMPAALGLIIGLIIGIFLAVIAYYVYSLAVYIFGVTSGYVLGVGLMLALGFEPGVLTFVVGVGGAVLFGLLFAMTKMPRFLIIFLTASGGAMAVLTGVFALFGQVPTLAGSLELTRFMVWESFFWLIIWALLAGFGMAFQYAIASMNEDVMKPYDWEEEYGSLGDPSKVKV